MNKQYRLRKNTPELKAGSIVEFHPTKGKPILGYWKGDVFYDKRTVEEQPEWFEEVIKEDEEAYEKLRKEILSGNGLLHQTPRSFGKTQFFFELSELARKHGVKMNVLMNMEQGKLDWDDIVPTNWRKKDWKVLTYRHKQTKVIKEVPFAVLTQKGKESDYEINSVQCISTGVVFKIGDTVRFKKTPLAPEGKLGIREHFGPDWIIDHFIINREGVLLARHVNHEMCEEINDKLILVSNTQNTFKCEDGVAKEGDTIYGISLSASGYDIWRKTEYRKENETISIGNNRKWFLSSEKANDFLIENYPCLSVVELRKFFTCLPAQLGDIVKSKIGNKTSRPS